MVNPTRDDTSSSAPRKKPGRIYRLQTQAFLDAAEDVDADEEILNDLLKDFGDDDFEDPAKHLEELHLDTEEALEPEVYDELEDPAYVALLKEGMSIDVNHTVIKTLKLCSSQQCFHATGGAWYEAPPQREGSVNLLCTK
jgi:hypothetical protein